MTDEFPIQVEIVEDSSLIVKARITDDDGSGAATGEYGEGNWIQQADVSTIECTVTDVTASTTTTPTVTIADVVLDTPVTDRGKWKPDAVGYNFKHHLGPANFPTGGNRILIEYKFTLASGVVFHLSLEDREIGSLSRS